MELIRLPRWLRSPYTAHSGIPGFFILSGRFTRPVICPRYPSPRITTGFLYLKVSSKASMVRSNISCGVEGVRTMA